MFLAYHRIAFRQRLAFGPTSLIVPASRWSHAETEIPYHDMQRLSAARISGQRFLYIQHPGGSTRSPPRCCPRRMLSTRFASCFPRRSTAPARGDRGSPPRAREIDESVAVEGDAFGLEHRALEARVLSIRRHAPARVDDTVPRNRFLGRGAYCPADPDGRQAVLDHFRQLPVSNDTTARNTFDDGPYAREWAGRVRARFCARVGLRPLPRASHAKLVTARESDVHWAARSRPHAKHSCATVAECIPIPWRKHRR
jgi:hypothetical protein